ncbi:C-1-tetrahydrofolate synthase, cytoplasmic [Smittium mucronatum]|uniref:C-1-tetrahydrofolate synthase, cytoplasmic n=1 Tax=Smittium mucronatum TaxID=133383 RepID=A0A1R0H3U0_9FUNG|nr:C-1-tetrahydrofolate synthase, cytoplasmic [Smittium mucronatum]
MLQRSGVFSRNVRSLNNSRFVPTNYKRTSAFIPLASTTRSLSSFVIPVSNSKTLSPYTLSTASSSISPLVSISSLHPYSTISMSSENVAPTATLIDGKAISASVRQELAEKVFQYKLIHPSFAPTLAVIQVGERKDSSLYVKQKQIACDQVGIKSLKYNLPETAQPEELSALIEKLNDDDTVNGILLQLPLPKHFHEDNMINSILPEKDVDGFHIENMGSLFKKNGSPRYISCTPKGIMKLLSTMNVNLNGARAVVLGRSDIVGTPVSALLTKQNATVTVCHSRTKNIEEMCRQADVLVVAIGIPQFVKADWIKPGAVVIDVGINAIPDSTKKSGSRWVGDVDFQPATAVASMITPVPGGVGPMTVAMLLDNLVDGAIYQFEKSSKVIINPVKINIQTPVPSDAQIATAATPKKIKKIAEELLVRQSELELYGDYKAKLNLGIVDRLESNSNGRYIVVAGITPTPLGEGKSTITIGLSQSLGAHLNKPVVACVRQPSQGPTFGIKGGAAGGGYAQVMPMQEFNLHLTGDIHAITAANNLLAAAIDARIFHESSQNDAALFRRLFPVSKGVKSFSPNMYGRLKRLGIEKSSPDLLTPEEIHSFVRLDIDPKTITWNRVLDVNDRFLRKITIGESPSERGMTRDTQFDISVASEIMAILALSNDLQDMKDRLSKIIVAYSNSGLPVTADDLGITGALTVLMKDAIRPNLMQTLEGTPVIVHAGPFANIAHGSSSIIADKIALKLVGTRPGEIDDSSTAGYVITEAGFGSDIGFEKFMNIKSRYSGLRPNCVVLVATVRALKMHGGGPPVVPGVSLPSDYTSEDVELVRRGLPNLIRHIENCRSFGIPVVVALNRFHTDSAAEINLIVSAAKEAGAFAAESSDCFANGGLGGIDLANAVIDACEHNHMQIINNPTTLPKFTYGNDVQSPNGGVDQIISNIESIAKNIYRASSVEFSELALKKLAQYADLGYANLPICMSKTQYSFSADPQLKNAPQDFVLPIRDARLSAGAGFLYPLCGEIQTMPGLPTRPCFYDIDIDADTETIHGLF